MPLKPIILGKESDLHFSNVNCRKKSIKLLINLKFADIIDLSNRDSNITI